MKKTLAQKPVLFTILLFIAAMFVAAAFTILFSAVGLRTVSSSLGRVIVALALILAFRSCFHWENSFKGIGYALPALILAVWNVAYNLLTGAALTTDILPVVLSAFAPALFEETIFRVIPFQKMQDNGMSALRTVIVTSLIFGLIHLTNIVGGDVVNTLIQTGYATAIGLLFGGIYVLTKDPVSVILLHFLTDFTSQIFENGSSAPVWSVFLMLAMLAAISVYGIMLAKKADRQ